MITARIIVRMSTEMKELELRAGYEARGSRTAERRNVWHERYVHALLARDRRLEPEGPVRPFA
jgi:hypothetical protein